MVAVNGSPSVGSDQVRVNCKVGSRMRRGRRAAMLLSAVALSSFARHAGATTYTWDPGFTGASTGPSGGTGTWDLNTTADWYNSGTTSDVVWTDNTGANDTATFGGTAGTVTLNTNLGALGVVFTTAGYMFSGTGILELGTTTAASNGIDTSAVGTGAETLGNIDVGSNQTWNISSAVVNVAGVVRDHGISHETLTVNGTGTTTFSGGLTLSNTNSARTVVLAGSESIDITGPIIDGGTNVTNGFDYQGTGTLTLANTTGNTFQLSSTQAVGVFSGTLAIAGAGALGSSANPLNNLQIGNNTALATFEGLGAGAITIANPLTLDGGGAGTADIGGTIGLNFSGTITNIGSVDDLNLTNTGGTTFSGNVYLSNTTTNNRTIVLGGNSPLVISGVIADANGATGANPCGVTYNGTSSLTLSNANIYTGTTTFQAGTLLLENNSAMGTSAFVFGGNGGGSTALAMATATLIADVGPITLSNATTLNSTDISAIPTYAVIGGTNSITFTGAISGGQSHIGLQINDTAITTFSGPVYLSNNLTNGRTLDISGSGNLLISGVVADANGAGLSGSLTYNGTGSLSLSNSNTYSGTTTLGAGTLIVNNTSGSATGTGNVTLNGGVLASGTTGSISGNVLAGTGSHTIAPGGIGAVGSLTIGGLTSSNVTTLNFDLGTGSGEITNGDLLTLGSGTVSIGSGTLMTFGGTPVSGDDYRLIGDTSSGAVVNAITLSNFTLPTAPAGLTFALSNSVDAGYIDLVVTPSGPATLTWNNTGAGSPTDGVTWDTTNNNWNNGSSATTYSNGAAVTFNDTNNGHYAVTLTSTVSPGSVTVSNSLGNYTFSGAGGKIVD
ncbi:MAG: autotransporter-associated beta strand repeat-containing protein, partial [Tepidisphaeraceae bacterium]